MENDMIFFTSGGRGLTSTSANHIANMAKEMIRTVETRLSALSFCSTSVSLIGSTEGDILRQGDDDSAVRGIEDELRRVASAKSLIAWLREAIKARERLIAGMEGMTLEEYARAEGTEIPKQPQMTAALTEEDYYAKLSQEERNRYYSLETLAAVLGKEIHPGGSFAMAREALASRMKNPREVKGDGRDTLIYTYKPTVDPQLVEETYFSLQKEYREAQSSLNAIKFDCARAVKDSQVAVSTEYASALEKWNGEMEELRARMGEYQRRKTKEYGAMKIVIPDSLEEIYREVSGLGKNDGQEKE